MDDSSRMYRDLPEGLCIKYTPSNMINISGDDIRCSCKRCKNKKILNPNVIMIYLL
jgi:hypothetical protein